jgi:hypothetical protein
LICLSCVIKIVAIMGINGIYMLLVIY